MEGSDTRVEPTNVNCDLYVTNRHMDPEVKKSSICAYVHVCVEKAYVHNNVCQLEPGIIVGQCGSVCLGGYVWIFLNMTMVYMLHCQGII